MSKVYAIQVLMYMCAYIYVYVYTYLYVYICEGEFTCTYPKAYVFPDLACWRWKQVRVGQGQWEVQKELANVLTFSQDPDVRCGSLQSCHASGKKYTCNIDIYMYVYTYMYTTCICTYSIFVCTHVDVQAPCALDPTPLPGASRAIPTQAKMKRRATFQEPHSCPRGCPITLLQAILIWGGPGPRVGTRSSVMCPS